MDVFMLKSKLHQATVTGANMEYDGSIAIDTTLMREVDILPYEKVLVANMATGARFETYVIPGEEGTGEISLNGATARLGLPGDRLIIFAFAQVSQAEAASFTPKIVRLDSQNRIIQRLSA